MRTQQLDFVFYLALPIILLRASLLFSSTRLHLLYHLKKQKQKEMWYLSLGIQCSVEMLPGSLTRHSRVPGLVRQHHSRLQFLANDSRRQEVIAQVVEFNEPGRVPSP